uniref:Ribbon-helix-helix protein, CopG family n=1 Tax=Ammonifex degensii TaxID=42838 RepID=A0A7C2I2W9_9THEO
MGLTKKVIVLFEPEQYERIKRRARLQGVSVGNLIRQAVDNLLAQGRVPDKKERLEAARCLTEAWEEVLEWDGLERLLERGHRS